MKQGTHVESLRVPPASVKRRLLPGFDPSNVSRPARFTFGVVADLKVGHYKNLNPERRYIPACV
jgi:hypothetical protein